MLPYGVIWTFLSIHKNISNLRFALFLNTETRAGGVPHLRVRVQVLVLCVSPSLSTWLLYAWLKTAKINQHSADNIFKYMLLNDKILHFVSNFSEIWPNANKLALTQVMNGLALNRWQAINRTNAVFYLTTHPTIWDG